MIARISTFPFFRHLHQSKRKSSLLYYQPSYSHDQGRGGVCAAWSTSHPFHRCWRAEITCFSSLWICHCKTSSWGILHRPTADTPPARVKLSWPLSRGSYRRNNFNSINKITPMNRKLRILSTALRTLASKSDCSSTMHQNLTHVVTEHPRSTTK